MRGAPKVATGGTGEVTVTVRAIDNGESLIATCSPGSCGRCGDLLGGGSQLIEVSLLAARAAVVVDGLRRGENVIPGDEPILLALADLLDDAAASVRFFQSGGQHKPPRPGALTDVRVTVVIESMGATGSSSVDTFRCLSARFRSARSPWSRSETDAAGAYLKAVASTALQRIGCTYQ